MFLLVFWKNAIPVRELPELKLCFWGLPESGALSENIGTHSAFRYRCSDTLDRSALSMLHMGQDDIIILKYFSLFVGPYVCLPVQSRAK